MLKFGKVSCAFKAPPKTLVTRDIPQGVLQLDLRAALSTLSTAVSAALTAPLEFFVGEVIITRCFKNG